MTDLGRCLDWPANRRLPDSASCVRLPLIRKPAALRWSATLGLAGVARGAHEYFGPWRLRSRRTGDCGRKAAWRMALQTQVLRRSLTSPRFSTGNPCAHGLHPSPQPSTVSLALNRPIPSSPLAPGEHHRTWYRDSLPFVLRPLPFLPTLPRPCGACHSFVAYAIFHSLPCCSACWTLSILF